MKKNILIAIAVASTALITQAATNETIIVTATRIESATQTIPSNPSVITSTDIEQGHYTSIPEALQKKAGIFFSNYADNPSQASINIRGFGGDNPHGKVLILLNGRKLNRPDQASINWAQIPIPSVERIEVVRGPNTVLYGDHAIGGVINILTKEPTDTPQTSLVASIASHEAYSQSLSTSGKLEGLGYTATLGHQSGDGYRDRSRYDTLSGSLRLSGDITDSLSAYAEASTVKEQHQLPGSLTLAEVHQNRKAAGNSNDAARESYLNSTIGFELDPTDDLIISLDGGVAEKDLESDMPSFGPINGFSDNKINTYTLSPKITHLSQIDELNNRIVFGIDMLRDDLNIDRFNDKDRSSKQGEAEVEKTSAEVYLHNTLGILNDKFLISMGARKGKSKIDVNSNAQAYPPWFIPAVSYKAKKHHTEEAYHFGAVARPTDELKIYAKYDKVFRYPFTDEQANYYGWGSDAFNSDLVPEKGNSYELGIDLALTTNFSLQTTAFRTDMKDEIAFVGWPVNANVNLDETTHRGAEISLLYERDVFILEIYYTWLQSEFSEGTNKGNEIPWVPQNKMNASLAILLSDSLTASTHVGYTGSMLPLGDNDNNTAEKQSGYIITDLLLEYSMNTKKSDVILHAGIDNLFGKEYNFLVTDYGFGTGYYPAPKQIYKAGVTINF